MAGYFNSKYSRKCLVFWAALCIGIANCALASVGLADDEESEVGEEVRPDPMMLTEIIEIPPGSVYVVEIDQDTWNDPGTAEVPHTHAFLGINGTVHWDQLGTVFGSLTSCLMQVQWSDGTPFTTIQSASEDLTVLYCDNQVNAPTPGTWSLGTSTDIYSAGGLNDGVFIDNLAITNAANLNLGGLLVQLTQLWYVYNWSPTSDDYYTCQTDGIELFWTHQDRYENIYND